MNKWCDGGPVIIDSWFGRIDETTVNRAVVDLTSHLMACWSKTLNMLLNAQGLLEAGALYQLRHGHLQIARDEVVSFIVEVVYECFDGDQQTRSTPCAQFDLVLKSWRKLQMTEGRFCEPDSPSWNEVQKVFSEVVTACPWIEGR